MAEFSVKVSLISFSSVGSKGVNFRLIDSKTLFDSASRSIFPLENIRIETGIAYINSKLALYTADCLNPTVNKTVGDN